MLFQALLPAILATVSVAAALPAASLDAILETRAVDPLLTCSDPTQGPLLYQLTRATSNLRRDGQCCIATPGSCAQIEVYGTASLILCGASNNNTLTCFPCRSLAPYFDAIAAECAGEDSGIWTRVNGAKVFEKGLLPAGTTWATVFTQALGPLDP